MILFLDNAESILDPQGTGAREIYDVVEELSRFKTICLCITSRTSTVPQHCKLPTIPTLSTESACNIFPGVYDDSGRSNIISDFLERLDFHVLPITLPAASHNVWDKYRLALERDTHNTQALQTDCHENMAATVELSLALPTFCKLGPDAHDPLDQTLPRKFVDPTTVPGSTDEGGPAGDEKHDDGIDGEHHYLQQETQTRARGLTDDYMAGARGDLLGFQSIEGELYKLRVKAGPSSAVGTHKTWEVVGEDGDYDYESKAQAAATESGVPEIPDTSGHQGPPSLLPIPQSEAGGKMVHIPEAHWAHQGYGGEIQHQTPPWQLIHQRLFNWAIIWPMSELDAAVGSTTRGHQVDEISLSVWATQSYKRYVRSRMTDSPQGRVDRLFVPPNVADAISTAVFNGKHGDACMMLRDLWAPFGLDGIPRLLIVLARHRSDEHHWVVHRCVRDPTASVSFPSPDMFRV